MRYPGEWKFAGGVVDADETPVQAAMRELEEEFQVKVALTEVWLDDILFSLHLMSKHVKNIPEKERKRCLQKATWRSFSFLHPKQILLVIERWQDARRWCLLVFWKSLHWQLKLEATCKLRLLSVKQTRQILNLLSIHACTCYTEHQTSWKIRTIMCIVSQYDFCLWRRRFTLFFHVFLVKF